MSASRIRQQTPIKRARCQRHHRYQTQNRVWWRRPGDASRIELIAQQQDLVLIETLSSGHSVQRDVQTGSELPYVRRWRDHLEPLLDWLDERAAHRAALRQHRQKMKELAKQHRQMKLLDARFRDQNLPAFACYLLARFFK